MSIASTKIVVLCAGLTWLVPLTAAASSADSLDREFLAGLRTRGLYRLAERHCLDHWNASGDETDRAWLAVELARTYAGWALESPAAARGALWQKAHAITARFLRDSPDHPRRPLVDLQDALVWRAEGSLLRIEAQATGAMRDIESARDKLRQAVRGLDQVAQVIQEQLRSARLSRNADRGDRLTVFELESIEVHVNFELGEALREQAICYPADSPDRLNSLTRALGLLTPLARRDPPHARSWDARVEQITCQRLLGRRQEASREIAAITLADPPPTVALRVEAERIRLALASDAPRDPLSELSYRERQGVTSPDLDLAHLEALLATAKQSTTQQRPNLNERITAQVSLIRDSHGPYWSRRAELMVGRAMAGNAKTGNAQTLRMAAESLYHAEKPREAIEAYDRAAAAALTAGDAAEALQLQFTAAAIAQQTRDHAQARERFRKIAAAWPQDSRAAEADFLAVTSALHLARNSALAERREQLRAAEKELHAHLERWPTSRFGDAAATLLGDLLKQQLRWQDAAESYRRVRPASQYYIHAVRNLAQCYEQQLRDQEGTQRIALVEEASDALTENLPNLQSATPTTWSSAHRQAVRACLRLRLRYGDPQDTRTQRLLNELGRLVDDEDQVDPEARVLRWEAAVRRGAASQAERLLDGMPQAARTALVESLTSLTSRLESLPEPAPTGRVILRALDDLALPEDEAERDTAAKLRLLRAQALAATGQHQQAGQLFAQLAQEFPKDGDLQEARARYLSTAAGPSQRPLALKAWTTVERRSRSGSDRWFRARLARIEMLLLQEDRDQAAKLIRLTRVLHPQLGGEQMRRKFERLAAEVP